MTKNKQNKQQPQRSKKLLKKVIRKNQRAVRQTNPARAPTKISKWGKAIRQIGRFGGGLLGMPGVGELVGAGISKISGQGDYQVKQNSLVQGGPPAFASLNSGIRIAHREYLGDVVSTTGYGVTSYDVNPVSRVTFPWLSRLALNFEEYTIKGLVFYFNTTCGSAISSTNNALGTVGLVTVYDPTDPALGSKRECEDYVGCVAGVPSCSLMHPIECKPRSNVLDRLYIQTSALNDDEDKKFYSHGTLNVFTQGMQAAGVTLGELWVSYDIEFYNPKILPIGTINQAYDYYNVPTYSDQTASKLLGPSNKTPIGNLLTTYSGSTGLFTIPTGTSAGIYLVYVAQSSPLFGYSFQMNSLSANLNGIALFRSDSTNQLLTPESSIPTLNHGAMFAIYKTDSSAATFGVNFAGAIPSGNLTADILIIKMPDSFSGTNEAPFLMQDKEKLIQEILARLSLNRPTEVEFDSDTSVTYLRELRTPTLERGKVIHPTLQRHGFMG